MDSDDVKKTVSVVVPSYLGEERLPLLLSALSAQEVDRGWEVVLVLDGTPDQSREVAERYRDRLPLKIVELSANQGRAKALNAGFAAASCDVLLRCDDDLVPPPHFVEGHAQHHDEQDPVGVIGFCQNVFPDSVYARVYGAEADQRHWAEACSGPADERWRYWAANCSVPRSTWAEVGPYDLRYVGWGWEDVDWGYRLHCLGVPIIVDPGLAADHLHVVETCEERVARAYSSGRARRTFESIHGEIESPGKRTTWSLCAGMAGLPNRRWHRFVGRLLDRRVDHLPPGVARRLVGFAVEAAAVGGRRERRQMT